MTQKPLHIIEEPCPCTTLGRCDLHNAAPELLKALEAVMLWVGEQADNEPPFRQARVALAKARA
mgnify:CR=1 FL=1